MTTKRPTLLGMFAKHWQPGQVKTRLASTIGDERAAAVHKLFVETLVRRFAGVADIRVLAFAPAEAAAEFFAVATSDWELAEQTRGDLGNRMRHFFETALSQAERVVLIGSDSPDLPLEFIQQAFAALATHDVVLGPATDGGYYLVGAARRVPPIFDNIAWSTNRVWQQTIERLQSAGIAWHQLPAWPDVDDQAALDALMTRLHRACERDAALRTLEERLFAIQAIDRANNRDRDDRARRR